MSSTSPITIDIKVAESPKLTVNIQDSTVTIGDTIHFFAACGLIFETKVHEIITIRNEGRGEVRYIVSGGYLLESEKCFKDRNNAINTCRSRLKNALSHARGVEENAIMALTKFNLYEENLKKSMI